MESEKMEIRIKHIKGKLWCASWFKHPVKECKGLSAGGSTQEEALLNLSSLTIQNMAVKYVKVFLKSKDISQCSA